MSENIIFVLDFIINSDKLINDSLLSVYFHEMEWEQRVIRGLGGYIPCILQIQLNEVLGTRLPSKDPSD